MSSMARTPDTAAAVLVSARAHRVAAEAHEAQLLQDALAWAIIHTTDCEADAAYYWDGSEQTGVPIAGEGAPLIREFAVAEFGAVIGLSPGAGRCLVGHAVELRYRLPRLWGRLVAGQVPAWRARRVAERTLLLPPEAARFVDAQIAPFAHRVGPVVLDRLVDEARARFLLDEVAATARRSADARHVTVHRDQVSFLGLMHVEADLDLADALDLDTAVSAGAAQLAACGSTETLDVRRALALGELARRQLALTFDPGESGAAPDSGPRARRRPARQVVLYVHLAEAAIAGGFGVARVENARTSLVTSDQVRSWCGATDTQVIVKPVIDLNERVRVDQYEIPDRLAERVVLRDGRRVQGSDATLSMRSCDEEVRQA